MCLIILSAALLDMNCCRAAHTFVIATLSLFVKVYGITLDLNFGPQDFFSLSEYQAHLENQIRRLYKDGNGGPMVFARGAAGDGIYP